MAEQKKQQKSKEKAKDQVNAEEQEVEQETQQKTGQEELDSAEKKYFVDAGQILSRKKVSPKPRLHGWATIIDASNVNISDQAFKLPLLTQDKSLSGDDIKVDLIRENGRIIKIKIACPCGRSTELNCEYAED
jgi:hypothetical protein